MIERKDILVVIPARGGSKGIPRKNIKPLNGKPLILYTVEFARKIFPDEQILVSTDDIEIKELVENTGLKVPFLRPEELATDSAPTDNVVKHCIDFFTNQGNDFKAVLILQPTSPFRRISDIDLALENFTEEVDGIVSVKETKANPYFTLMEEDENGFLYKSKKAEFTRRQDCPTVYELNGSLYLYHTNVYTSNKKDLRVKKIVLPKELSIDLDDEYDWKLAECLTPPL